MNNKIKQLAFKIFDECDPREPGTYIQLNVEKFAELLGKELANHIAGQLPDERLDDWHEGYHAGVQRSVDCLKDFGVEQ
jgi:hypothetical protein